MRVLLPVLVGLILLFFLSFNNFSEVGNDICIINSDCLSCSNVSMGICVEGVCKCIQVVPAPVGSLCSEDEDCKFWSTSCGCGCININENVPIQPSEFCALNNIQQLWKEKCMNVTCKCVTDVCVDIKRD